MEEARIIPDIIDRVSPASVAELEVQFHGKAIKVGWAGWAYVPQCAAPLQLPGQACAGGQGSMKPSRKSGIALGVGLHDQDS